MSRLYKKCFIASGGVHVLLALILIICPAFLASNPKQSDVQPITFIPDILTPSRFAGGGDPNADRPANAAPTPPAPVAPPKPAPAAAEPKPVVKEVAPPKPAEESMEVPKDNKSSKKKVEFDLKPVVRKPNAKPASQDTSEADSQARDQKAKRDRLISALDSSASNIGRGTGKPAKLVGSRGPGGGGPSYASYASLVLTIYDNAWIAPEDATSEDATVEVSVTIASNGTVVARKIVKRSGDPAVDASVQRALDKVNSIGRPFPEGMNEAEHTYRIPFNMKTKRGAA